MTTDNRNMRDDTVIETICETVKAGFILSLGFLGFVVASGLMAMLLR